MYTLQGTHLDSLRSREAGMKCASWSPVAIFGQENPMH